MKPVLNRSISAAAAAAALGFAVALPANAEGLYVGGSLGQPSYRDSINGVSGSGGNDIGGKAFGGYQFTPNFALETGGVVLGRVDNDVGMVKGHGLFLDAVGTLPIASGWSLLGRLGVAHAKVESSGGDDSGTGVKYGLGVQYDLTPKTALRGEWEDYRLAVFDGHPNVHQYTFGVKANF